jgi:DNA-binding NarL/FixJ family response regulator
MNAVLAPALEQTAARPHAPTRLRVLCVDDEPYVTDGLARQLHRHYEVLGAASGAEGLEILHREGDIAVIVSDMCMPTTDGVSFLRLARDIAPDAARVVLSGHADTQSALEAINFGQVCAYLLKPCTVSALLGAVNAAAGRYRVNAAQRLLLDAASQEEHPTLEAVFARAVRIFGCRYAALAIHDGCIWPPRRLLTHNLGASLFHAHEPAPLLHALLRGDEREHRYHSPVPSPHPGLPGTHPLVRQLLGVPHTLGHQRGWLYFADARPSSSFTDDDAKAAALLARVCRDAWMHSRGCV